MSGGNDRPGLGVFAFGSRQVEGSIELRHIPGKVEGIGAVGAVRLEHPPGPGSDASSDLKGVGEQMGQPVGLLPLLGSSRLLPPGAGQYGTHVDDALGSLDHPGEDGGAGVLVEVFHMVLDAAAPGDPGIDSVHLG